MRTHGNRNKLFYLHNLSDLSAFEVIAAKLRLKVLLKILKCYFTLLALGKQSKVYLKEVGNEQKIINLNAVFLGLLLGVTNFVENVKYPAFTVKYVCYKITLKSVYI